MKFQVHTNAKLYWVCHKIYAHVSKRLHTLHC